MTQDEAKLPFLHLKQVCTLGETTQLLQVTQGGLESSRQESCEELRHIQYFQHATMAIHWNTANGTSED